MKEKQLTEQKNFSINFRSKFIRACRTFTSLDGLEDNVNIQDPICIEPTSTGTRYLFPLNGQINSKELESVADDDDSDSNSSAEDVDESDEKSEIRTTVSRSNAFPKIVFFGTGSTSPGVYKTVTAILVHTTYE